MTCKAPLVFTALALARITKQGKKPRYLMLRDCASPWISAHTSSDQQYSSEGNCSQNLLQMLFSYLKLSMNPSLIWLPVSGRRPCPRKAQGCFSEGDCLLDEDADGFCLQPYSQRRCLEVCPGLRTGTSGRQQLICLITLNPEPGHPPGMLPGLPGMGKGSPVPPERLVTR